MRFKDFMSESIEDKGIFKAVFMAGTPGSGKSYVIKRINSGVIEPRIVNTDIWTEWFGDGGSVDWKEYGGRIKLLSKKQLSLYLNSLLPLWVDGTSGNPPAMMRRNGILKSLGYDTAMIWIDTPLEDALERNRNRKRVVDEDMIKRMYDKVSSLKPYYVSEFSNFTEILNGEGELIDKTIISAYRKMEKFFNSPIQNPIGKEFEDTMRKNKWKYMSEVPGYDIQYINKIVDAWYRK